MQAGLDAERQRIATLYSSEREKGKHLLYLFQCDLLPGVSGKILESKGQRDFVVVKHVHPVQKIAGWTFIVLLNAGMLFYILLFALTQNSHRQGAWAASFAVWLVVEVLLVSSLIVLIMHVILPSMILKDVTKIKKKLMDNIKDFNQRLKKKGSISQYTAGDPRNFNAAEYLFLSTRLALELPDLKEAQMIAHYRTPWPKQSYQHETNVSKAYSRKFAALFRSFTIVLIFVITTFLSIPPTAQDIVLQMVSTVLVGYVALLHLELYFIYPILVVLPLLVVAMIVHFLVQSSRGRERLRLQQLMKEIEPEVAEIHPATEQDNQQLMDGEIEENTAGDRDEDISEEDDEDAGDGDDDDHDDDDKEAGGGNVRIIEANKGDEKDYGTNIAMVADHYRFASNIGPLHTPLQRKVQPSKEPSRGTQGVSEVSTIDRHYRGADSGDDSSESSISISININTTTSSRAPRRRIKGCVGGAAGRMALRHASRRLSMAQGLRLARAVEESLRERDAAAATSVAPLIVPVEPALISAPAASSRLIPTSSETILEPTAVKVPEGEGSGMAAKTEGGGSGMAAKKGTAGEIENSGSESDDDSDDSDEHTVSSSDDSTGTESDEENEENEEEEDDGKNEDQQKVNEREPEPAKPTAAPCSSDQGGVRSAAGSGGGDYGGGRGGGGSGGGGSGKSHVQTPLAASIRSMQDVSVSISLSSCSSNGSSGFSDFLSNCSEEFSSSDFSIDSGNDDDSGSDASVGVGVGVTEGGVDSD